MNKRDICTRAADLVGNDRAEVYGDNLEMHGRIAKLWSAYLGFDISALDAAHMMILFKLARAAANPAHVDSYIDIAGYAACAGEIGSVLAPTVQEIQSVTGRR